MQELGYGDILHCRQLIFTFDIWWDVKIKSITPYILYTDRKKL